jgi:hypothetical protein
MKEKRISKRVWLNPDESSSTGSVVVYSGPAYWNKKKKTSFVEIADCLGKVRLHKSDLDTEKQFIEKVKLLRDTLDWFINELK